MTLIDRRVLINAPPEAIWAVLGDLTALSRWHINCKQSSVLTTFSRGVGARRRNFMKNGPDTVEEIVSWYDNLGYEYRVVDGLPFRRNQGRLRLQAIPEGTIVQWTFEYQLGGPLGGLRDRLFVHRKLDREIADSLKQLKRLVEASGVHMDATTREKVSMRPAPSASERAARAARIQPGSTSLDAGGATAAGTPPSPPPDALPERPTQPTAFVFEDDLPPLPGIDEPPLGDEDTRPSTVEQATSRDATRPIPVVGEGPAATESSPPLTGAPETSSTTQDIPLPAEPELTAADTRPFRLSPAESQPNSLDTPSPAPLEATPPPAPVAAEMQSSPSSSDQTRPSMPAVEVAVSREEAQHESPPTPPKHDPVGPSIWEVFGVAPPEEIADQQGAPATAPPPPVMLASRVTKPGPDAVEWPVGWRARRSGSTSLVQCRLTRPHPGLRRQLARQALGAHQR